MDKVKMLFTILFGAIILSGCGQNNDNNNISQMDSTVKEIDTSNQLAVSLKVLNENEINITVTNVCSKIVRAYSYVKTYENHYDYFEVEALTPDHDEMVFSFVDSRDKSAPIIVELKPGESFSHTIDLIKWSERSVNVDVLKRAGLNHLPHGIKIRAKYRNSPCDNCNEYYKSIWTGFIYSKWVNF
jgi:hypothetical protein